MLNSSLANVEEKLMQQLQTAVNQSLAAFEDKIIEQERMHEVFSSIQENLTQISRANEQGQVMFQQ